MAKPGEFFDKKYNVRGELRRGCVGKAGVRLAKTPDAPAGGLVADSHDGLPFPEGGEGFQSEGSNFRKQTNKTVPAELKAVVDFYRRELAAADWKENKAGGEDRKDIGDAVVHAGLPAP